MDYKNKTILITGGTSGIGLALANIYSQQCARLYILARSKERPDYTENSANCPPPASSTALYADVRDSVQVEQAISKMSVEVGAPDLVINSAGVAHPGRFQELDPQIFHWMMDVNYFGAVNVTRAVLPGMIERGSGHVVNICSFAGLVGVYGYTAYGASKFAMRGFSDALRMEIKPIGIRVSIVYPGDTETPQLNYENQHKPEEIKRIIGMVPGTKPMSAEKAAQAIVRGIERGQEAIYPDPGIKILSKLYNLVGNGAYPVLDWLLKKAQSRVN